MLRKIAVSIMAAAFAVALLNGCEQAVSAEPMAQLSWTNPTTREDGSAYDATTEQASVRIQWGTTPGGPYPNQYTSPGAATSASVPYSGGAGKFYFVAVAVAMDGQESAPSNEAVKVNAFRPSAVSGLKVD